MFLILMSGFLGDALNSDSLPSFLLVIESPRIIFGEAIVLTGDEGYLFPSRISLNFYLSLKKVVAMGSLSCNTAISE